MKLYGFNNIVKCGSEIYFIDIIGERFHLRNETSITLYGITVDDDEKDLIEDIEMSDWVLDALFPRKYYYNEKDFYWVVDSIVSEGLNIPYFKIEKSGDGEDCYTLIKGNLDVLYFNNVRELQNAYHFFSDIEDCNFLNDCIDTKLKNLFKLI